MATVSGITEAHRDGVYWYISNMISLMRIKCGSVDTHTTWVNWCTYRLGHWIIYTVRDEWCIYCLGEIMFKFSGGYWFIDSAWTFMHILPIKMDTYNAWSNFACTFCQWPLMNILLLAITACTTFILFWAIYVNTVRITCHILPWVSDN